MYKRLITIGLSISLNFATNHCMEKKVDWNNFYTLKYFTEWRVAYNHKTHAFTGRVEIYPGKNGSLKFFDVTVYPQTLKDNTYYTGYTYNEHCEGDLRGPLDPKLAQELFEHFKEIYSKQTQQQNDANFDEIKQTE